MDILNKVMTEKQAGEEYIKTKRTQIRERVRKYNNQSKTKININLIANHIDTKIASDYDNELTVKFVSRDGFYGKEKANQMTTLAEFDRREQKYGQLRYQLGQDKYFMGVGVFLESGRDKESQAPEFVSINPLSCIPDPAPSQKGNFDAENYRYMGFMMRTTIYELRDSGMYDTGSLNKMIQDHYETENELTEQAYNDKNNFNDITTDTLTENFSLLVYHHFTYHKGKKVLVTTDGSVSCLLRYKEIKPVLKEEIKQQRQVPRPFGFMYYKPERSNFYGVSIPDEIEDKQNAMNILANLNVAKSKKEALGGRFLVNSRLIKNKEDILKPSIDTQYFRVDENTLQPGESLGNAMMELPQSNIKQDTITMYNFLESEANKTTGIDQLQRGIVPDKSMTKAEAQQIQSNANLLSIREKRVQSWGIKKLFFLRWRAYIQYFDPKSKKLVTLDANFEYGTEEITNDSFKYVLMPDIKIGTKDELNAIDEKRKAFLSLYLPQVKQDPSKKQLTKDILEREFLRLQGYSANQTNIFVPLSKDERIMIDEYIPMINSDVIPKSIFQRISDPFTAYIYVQQCTETEAKQVVLQTLKETMGAPEQQQAQPQQGGAANSATNIQMAQQAQQAGQPDIVTRGNLQQQTQ